MSSCRICGSTKTEYVSYFRPYVDYEGFEVYDCLDCRSRFVHRSKDVFALMHAIDGSPYSFHKEIAQRSKRYFDKGCLNALRKSLSRTPKFRFIIDSISSESKGARILELGCSLGYLTAYFILGGYNILGSDISETPIRKARAFFGDHFVVVDEDFYKRYENSFDFVYHLGTIGCVDRPVDFTMEALNLLKPRGRLLFNAPDVRAVKQMGVLWNSTPPPDLITIYDETFWNRFNSVADVDITYEPYDHYTNGIRYVSRWLHGSYIDLRPNSFYQRKSPRSSARGKGISQTSFRLACRFMVRLFYYLSRWNLIHHYPGEFGMYVTMAKKEGA